MEPEVRYHMLRPGQIGVKITADDRLIGLGDTRRAGDQVYVQTADDGQDVRPYPFAFHPGSMPRLIHKDKDARLISFEMKSIKAATGA